jgi:hypothetical protein
VGPRDGLDAEVRGKILCRGSNPGRPATSQKACRVNGHYHDVGWLVSKIDRARSREEQTLYVMRQREACPELCSDHVKILNTPGETVILLKRTRT